MRRGEHLVAAAPFVVQGVLLATLLTSLPRLQERHGLGADESTVMVLAVTLLAVPGSLIGGSLGERHGGGVAVRVAFVLTTLGSALVWLAPSVPALLTGLLLYGLGLGVLDAGSNTVGLGFERRRARPSLPGLYAAGSVASILGALLSASGLDPLLGVLAAAAVVALSWARLPGAVLEPLVELTGAPGAARPGEGRRVLLGAGVVLAAFYLLDLATSTWSTLHLSSIGASASLAPLGYAGYQGGALLSRLLGDSLVARFGHRGVALVVVLTGSGALAVAALGTSPVLVVLAFTLVGCGPPLLAPIAFSALGPVGPVAVSRLNLFNYAGALGGALVVGALAPLGGYALGLGVVAALVASAVVVAVRLPRRRGVSPVRHAGMEPS